MRLRPKNQTLGQFIEEGLKNVPFDSSKRKNMPNGDTLLIVAPRVAIVDAYDDTFHHYTSDPKKAELLEYEPQNIPNDYRGKVYLKIRFKAKKK